MKLCYIVIGLALLSVLSYSASATDRILGPFASEIGQLRFELSDGNASTAGEVRLQIENGGQHDVWSTIYSRPSNSVVYIYPLSPDESAFLILESLGSGYRTVILHVQSQQSVVTQLDASGKGFPEVFQAGVEETRFVIIPNSSKSNNVIDAVDIYSLQNGVYKHQRRVSTGEKLSVVEQLARRIDHAAAERRKGVVVHP